LKKSQAKSEEIDSSTSSGPGGIAAMAAAAALKKTEAAETINSLGTAKKATETPQSDKGKIKESVLCTDIPFLSTVLEAGISEAAANPRDLPSFFCLHLLSIRIQHLVLSSASQSKSEESVLGSMQSFSRRLLLRSLAISNQATSIGMVGWLEYGSSNPIERNLSLPFELLQNLSCTMASAQDWNGATDVLASLVMRCEEDLLYCHPITLSSMLDLAAALMQSENADLASSISDRVVRLLRSFLEEVEDHFFRQCSFQAINEQSSGTIVFLDECIDALSTLQAFASQFRNGLSRDFLKLLGPRHPVLLMNHVLVADTFSVLANCRKAVEPINDGETKTTHRNDNGPNYYWWIAFSHYQVAFQGWIKAHSLSHPSAASAACSVARCLREVDKLDQAIAILETLASCLEQKIDLELGEEAKHDNMDPINASSKPQINAAEWDQEQTRVHCLWMLAVMTVEKSPDERGRQRALSLLHTSSLALRHVLNSHNMKENSEVRKACLDLYRTIEDEAEALFSPLEQLEIPKDFVPKSLKSKQSLSITTSNVTGRRQKASWEVLTPMREKRDKEWSSPRKERLAAKKAGASKLDADIGGAALLETATSKKEAAVVKLV
jgi:hypothetical protein